MVEPATTVLTERQAEVLELRAAGLTQAEVAERLDTTVSNVSGIERAAEANVTKARQTLELVQGLQAAVHVDIPAGTSLEEVVETVYDEGDTTGIEVAYARPELSGHLYEQLSESLTDGRLQHGIRIDMRENGEVTVRSDYGDTCSGSA